MDIDVTDKIEDGQHDQRRPETISSTRTARCLRRDRRVRPEHRHRSGRCRTSGRRSPSPARPPRRTSTSRSSRRWIPTPCGALDEPGRAALIGDLSTYANEVLKERIRRCRASGPSTASGLRLRQVRVRLDQDKLRAYQITASDVVQALGKENVELPGEAQDREPLRIRHQGQGGIPRVPDFNDLIIAYFRELQHEIPGSRTRRGRLEEKPHRRTASTGSPPSPWACRSSRARTPWRSSTRSRRNCRRSNIVLFFCRPA